MDADVAVLGAGPAGSTVANRLARLGYDVQMFESSAFPRPHVGESLHAQVLPLLDQLAFREEINDAGFLRPRGAIVFWAGECRFRTEVASGFQVDRCRFDAILLNAARNAGARIAQPARVTHFTKTSCGVMAFDGDGERDCPPSQLPFLSLTQAAEMVACQAVDCERSRRRSPSTPTGIKRIWAAMRRA